MIQRVVGSSSLTVEQSQETDERFLIRRAQAGDIPAFEYLYRRHVGRVYALCLRMCGEAGHAEEMAQEAFVRAWERLGSFRGESALATWLHRVTVNVVLSDRRTKARRRERTQTEEELARHAEEPAKTKSPGLRVDLEEAIAALPPGAREVFVLHDVEGYKHREIAEMTGIAAGTSKAHLHRARMLLREHLKR